MVGENSTGKTSLFDLLEVLDAQGFSIDHSPWGGSDRIKSSHDFISRISGANQATVGFIKFIKGNKQRRPSFGRLVTYSRDGNGLVKSKVTLLSGRLIVTFGIDGNSMKVMHCQRLSKKYDSKKIAEFVVHSHRMGSDTTNSKSTKINPNYPLLFQFSVVFDQLQNTVGKIDREEHSGFFYASPFNLFRFGPIRKETERFFRATEVEAMESFRDKPIHFPQNLKELNKDKTALNTIERFGKESGLYDGVKINSVSLSVAGEVHSLMFEKYGSEFFVDELGYGVGQIVPIVVDMTFSNRSQTLVERQPLCPVATTMLSAFEPL